MILQKSCTLLTLLSLILFSVMTFFINPQLTHGQESQYAGYACEIDSFPSANIEIFEELETGDIQASVRVHNPSEYIFYGLKVGIALYADEGQQTPDYWVVLEEENFLSGGNTATFSGLIDGTHVPAGEYVVRAFVSQGDFDNLLTTALVDYETTASLVMQKTSPKTESLDVAITVNGDSITQGALQYDDYTQLEIEAITTNGTSLPIRDVALEMVVAEGAIPGGTAISHQDSSSVKLNPGNKKRSQTVDQRISIGEHTLYSTLAQAGVLHEMQSATIILGEEPGRDEFVHLSGVGVKELETGGLEVTGCVSRLGGDVGPGLSEVVMMNSSTGDSYQVGGESVLRTFTFNTFGAEISDGLVVSLDVPLVSLSESEEPEGDWNIPYATADSISLTYECIGDNCAVYMQDPTPAENDNNYSKNLSQFSFYHYAGIIIAAALLGYIMLRRLHPDSNQPRLKSSEGEESDIELN